MALPYTGRPDTAACRAYLESIGQTYDDAEISNALNAEIGNQARVCRTPAEGAPFPSDLAESLKRRVARNLLARSLPLGYQATITDVGVGSIRLGWDAEIRRYEAPFRKVRIG